MSVFQPSDFRSDRASRRASHASRDLEHIDEVDITATGSDNKSVRIATVLPARTESAMLHTTRRSSSQLRNMHSQRLRQSIPEHDYYEVGPSSRASTSSVILDRQLRQLSMSSAPDTSHDRHAHIEPREARACSLSKLETEAEREWQAAKQSQRTSLVHTCLQESSASRRWSMQVVRNESNADAEPRRSSLFERRDVSLLPKLGSASPRREGKLLPLVHGDEAADDGKPYFLSVKEARASPKSPRRDFFSMFRQLEEVRTRSSRAGSAGAADHAHGSIGLMRSPSSWREEADAADASLAAGPSRFASAVRPSLGAHRKSSIATQMRRMYAAHEKAEPTVQPRTSMSEAIEMISDEVTPTPTPAASVSSGSSASPAMSVDGAHTLTSSSSEYFSSSPSLRNAGTSDTDTSDSPDETPKSSKRALIPSFSDPFFLIQQQQSSLTRKLKAGARPFILAGSPSASTRRGSNYPQGQSFAPETMTETSSES